MSFITDVQAGTKNASAFLDMIAMSELGAKILASSDDGYNVIVVGQDKVLELFSDYSKHPFEGGRKSKVIRPGLTSNAAGRYQQMLKDWPHYRDLLRLPDFGKLSQDKVALQHIRECRALPDINAGRIEAAIIKCSPIWASFPGAGYNQPEHKLDVLVAAYRQAGGVVA